MELLTVPPGDRVVGGLALPYDVLVRAGRRKLVFAPGCAEWPPRVRMVREHSPAIRIGRAVELVHAAAGLAVALELDRHRAADRALARIVDGTERGLSCGLDFLETRPHPDLPGVLLVLRAWLREITLTRTPAATGARITFWPGC